MTSQNWTDQTMRLQTVRFKMRSRLGYWSEMPPRATGETPSPLATTESDLAKGFQSPPDSAKPELFWDWMHDLVARKASRMTWRP